VGDEKPPVVVIGVPCRPEDFPRLPQPPELTSDASPLYNCVAWAAGEDYRWWWPVPGRYWPADAPRQETEAAFERAFELQGYAACDDESLVEGFEKVALYSSSGSPSHAVRQLPSGAWTSKNGASNDIAVRHPNELAGPIYGSVFRIMVRPRK